MELFHSTRNADYRRPFGAAAVGTAVFLALDAPRRARCTLLLRQEGAAERRLPMTWDGTRFSVTFTAPDAGTLLWYGFLAETEGERAFCAPVGGGCGRACEEDRGSFQITVYVPDPGPDWYTKGVVYQIFPDRFRRGSDWQERRRAKERERAGRPGPAMLFHSDWNDVPFYPRDPRNRVTRWPFFGGTLEGIREKLPYLKSLGIGSVYLNPIFSAASNHRYDTADYTRIDPLLGEEADFTRLAREAGRWGIRLILDGVFSHTGADSVYFDRYGVYGTGETYRRWYRFGPEYPNGYDSWWGVADLPCVDENDPTFREYICGDRGVVRRWMAAGASGWRLDVADELPDEFIAALRRTLGDYPESLLLGEVWEDASNKISYGVRRRYLLGEELHSVMNYPLRSGLMAFFLGETDAAGLAESLTCLQENYPPEAFAAALNLIGSHDRARSLSVLGGAPDNLSEGEREAYRLSPEALSLAKKRLMALSLLQYAMPGVPCLYYGDEAGAQGLEDPFNRGPYPWGREDPELLAHFRTLGQLRGSLGCLTGGEFRAESPDRDVFLIRRRSPAGEVLALANRAGEARTVTLAADRDALCLFTGTRIRCSEGRLTLTLAAYGARLLALTDRETRRLPGRTAVRALRDLPGGTLDGAERFLDRLDRLDIRTWVVPPCHPAGETGPTSLFAGDPAVTGSGAPEPHPDFAERNAAWLEAYAAWRQSRFGADPAQTRREQAAFFARWDAVRAMAAKRNIRVAVGLPLAPAADSADAAAEPADWLLDDGGAPLARLETAAGPAAPDWTSQRRRDFSLRRAQLRHALAHFDLAEWEHPDWLVTAPALAGETGESFPLPGPGLELYLALAAGTKENDLPMTALPGKTGAERALLELAGVWIREEDDPC